MPNKTVHVWVSGRVQGVCFRYWTMRTAQHLGLTGWVRNLQDRRVEAVFSGDSKAVDKMLLECQCGPDAAVVRGVENAPYAEPVDFTGFSVRPTR